MKSAGSTIPRIVIAGTHSGVGKTSVTIGVMAALRRAGWDVKPFKVGPDYIDPGYHAAVCGAPSWSLDSWMLGFEGMRASFARGAGATSGARTVAVIEGMMGLHDGADPMEERGSTAEIAQWLDAPVVLVIDAAGLARSAGALTKGYRDFDPRVRLAGVVANRVAGEGHAAYLRPGIEALGVPFLGWLPENPDIRLPERRLGLTMPFEQPDLEALIVRLADWTAAGIDLDRLTGIAEGELRTPEAAPGARPAPKTQRAAAFSSQPSRHRRSRARIAIANDAAFCFYYPENVALLEEAGAEIVSFSPLTAPGLPDDVDGLYLGGGYPELHAKALSANQPMRLSIAQAIFGGQPTFAECGGYMYLCSALVTADGRRHEMAGVIPGEALLNPRLQAIGYRDVTLSRDSPLGAEGTRARGHEFRYSRFEGAAASIEAAFCLEDGAAAGYATPTLAASYIHLHFGSNPELARHFVDQCARKR